MRPRYAFDVEKASQAFTNRRVLTYVDTGVPDGVQVDSNGNIYASCGDGVQVGSTSAIRFTEPELLFFIRRCLPPPACFLARFSLV